LVVADGGHVSGPRIIDYVRFTDSANPAMAILGRPGRPA